MLCACLWVAAELKCSIHVIFIQRSIYTCFYLKFLDSYHATIVREDEPYYPDIDYTRPSIEDDQPVSEDWQITSEERLSGLCVKQEPADVDLNLESPIITNDTQTSSVKHGLVREGDQAAINTPQMSEVLKKIASVAQKQNMVGNMENTAESGVNSNIHVPNFSHSTQVYRGVHKIQSSKNCKDGLFPCVICKTCGFRSRHDLKMHMRQHKDEKPYKCSHCSYRSKHNANLKLHIAHRHSNARPFHCPVCSHTSKSSSDLRKHMIVHSGKKRTKKNDRRGWVVWKLNWRVGFELTLLNVRRSP